MTQPPPRGRFSASACTLIYHQGKILLVRHGGSGLWVPPGGKAEADESPRANATREAREETGVHVNITRFLGVMYLPGEGPLLGIPAAGSEGPFAYPCHFYTFAGWIAPDDIERIKIPEPEITDYAWVDIDTIPPITAASSYIDRNIKLAVETFIDARTPYYWEITE